MRAEPGTGAVASARAAGGQELGFSSDAFCMPRFFINGHFKKASDHWRFQ